MKRELVIDALRMAWFTRQLAAGTILHSDRGSQYCNDDFHRALTSYGMRSSMSCKASCWDNAPTESLWGSLKVGRLYGRKFETRRAAMDDIVDWLAFYNHRRLNSSLGYVSPMQFERAWLPPIKGKPRRFQLWDAENRGNVKLPRRSSGKDSKRQLAGIRESRR